MTKTSFKFIEMLQTGVIIGMTLLVIVACGGSDGKSVSKDGTGTIFIHNNDNKDYRVELRKASDDTVLSSFNLDDFGMLDNDWMDSFEDVPEDTYYIVIFINSTEVDRSNRFLMEDHQTECYRINDDGHLRQC